MSQDLKTTLLIGAGLCVAIFASALAIFRYL